MPKLVVHEYGNFPVYRADPEQEVAWGAVIELSEDELADYLTARAHWQIWQERLAQRYREAEEPTQV